MYSIKNLLQSAQLRQALTRKAPNAVSATPTPWIAGATFMGKAPSQVATQMQYVAANSIHSSPNMANHATAGAPASDADSAADSAPIAHTRSEKRFHLPRPDEKARSLYAASS